MTETPVVLRPAILAQAAYQQGKPAGPNDVKLSSNELPFAPLPSVLAAVRAADALNRYPDATAARLRGALATRFDVAADQVLVGAGSVALLYAAALAAAGPGDEIVYAWNSFEAYPGMVTVTGATSVQVPLRPDATHDLDAMAEAITDRTRLVILCTPNNPTGPVIAHDDLVAFLDRVRDDLLVLVDEAYVEFVTDRGAADASKLLGTYRNMIMARTFSKAWGLAGLRVGYLIGDAQVIRGIRSATIPLSTTGQAEAAALAALEASDEAARRVTEVTVRRNELSRALRDQGWDIPDSQANFVWLATRERTAEADSILREHGIIARPYESVGIRVTIGDDASVVRILTATAAVIDRYPYLRRDQSGLPEYA
ncbi:putative phenylalanine aminotransferase [Pseudoclavibacter endophyticus]|uniref:Aminotransferase class I/II-fold pyridoxal phosphate-dependent enzyme n=1 Tax=Pseudoclavibacter endophyticus TaxID=1778590 RepID=A0A6H9WM23_9MICO|nr:histidinol-phosphate transaminase [Pseudoclavibacter endophyticus]KAB1648861.1 aminotransferase class I/II-fold pyridoxal phosphate-dependent enzyme [Pseudoclavibacter endophyticus]GGA67774.1 putative phenylalanine aminotransferase [Pseudoclavibacter endophyticus]